MAPTIGVRMAAAHERNDAHVIIAHIFLCCSGQSVYRTLAGMARQRGCPPALDPRRLSQPTCAVRRPGEGPEARPIDILLSSTLLG